MPVAHSLNTDPLRNFRFIVTIAHPQLQTLARMGFMSVSGLAMQTEVIPYREGGNNTTTRKMPGQTDFGPITLSHGTLAAPVGNAAVEMDSGYRWFKQIFSFMQGNGFGSASTDFRVPVAIDILQHPVTVGAGSPGNANPGVKMRFVVYNAWVMALAWSDLDAGGNAASIEQMTLAHEGYDVIYGSTVPGQFLSPSPAFSG